MIHRFGLLRLEAILRRQTQIRHRVPEPGQRRQVHLREAARACGESRVEIARGQSGKRATDAPADDGDLAPHAGFGVHLLRERRRFGRQRRGVLGERRKADAIDRRDGAAAVADQGASAAIAAPIRSEAKRRTCSITRPRCGWPICMGWRSLATPR